MNGEDVMEVAVYKERREHWKGDCKVEFNQPFCWLYSVPIFL